MTGSPAGQAIRGVALGVVVTGILQTTLGAIGLAVAGVPFVSVLATVMFVLCIAQIGPILVLLAATAWVYLHAGAGWGTFMLVWALVVGLMDERVAAARPDLIVIWGSGFPPATLAALRRLGVPLYVDEPSSLDGISASMLRLGRLTAAAGAPEAAARFRAAIEELRTRFASRPEVSVFYQVWAEPLMTLGGRHVLSEGLRVCGARNVFERLAPIAPQVSVEAVLAVDPQMFVTAEPGGVDRGALQMWKRFPQQRAVAGGHLVTIDADRINRHTPRLAAELAVLCERIDTVRRAMAAVRSRP